MSEQQRKKTNQKLRAKRVRGKVKGTSERPRLSVKISNLHISAQMIDDTKHTTLVAATSVGSKLTGTKTDKAAGVGIDIGAKAKKAKITKVVLDRGSRKYAKRLHAFAENARKAGLEF
ncbi:50S ribosomal protein L18 [Candidatus Saccharibacteria bacterium]|nr:50S ribosomal protein L18 [Candidatus Saccharibacteria bacterium]